MFSWNTQDTDRSICNTYSQKSPFPVTMIDDKGNKWRENNYNGYGIFGEKDFFKLLAEMNNLKTREDGINLVYSGKPFLSPNLIETRNESSWKWINDYPKNCIFQGFFYEWDSSD